MKPDAWLRTPNAADLKTLFVRFAGSPTLFYALAVFLICSLGLVLLQPPMTVRRKDLVFLLSWTFVPAILCFGISQWTPMFHERYVLYSTIGMALLVAYLLESLPVGNIVKCLLLAFPILLLWMAMDFASPKPPNWRALASYVRTIRKERSAILIYPPYYSIPFEYYFDNAAFLEYARFPEEEYYKKLENDQVFPVAFKGNFGSVLTKLDPAAPLIFIQVGPSEGTTRGRVEEGFIHLRSRTFFTAEVAEYGPRSIRSNAHEPLLDGGAPFSAPP
jgi:hypothetical protein